MARWLYATALMLMVSAAGCSPTSTPATEESIAVPQLDVQLRIDRSDTAAARTGLRVTVKNTDPQFAACFHHQGMPTDADLDHFFQVFSPEGRPVAYRGTAQGYRSLYPTVMYIRPQQQLESFVAIEEGFAGALQPGACIAVRLDFANCRSLERWDLNDPAPGEPQAGRGQNVSSWRVSDQGQLTQLPSDQQCAPQ